MDPDAGGQPSDADLMAAGTEPGTAMPELVDAPDRSDRSRRPTAATAPWNRS